MLSLLASMLSGRWTVGENSADQLNLQTQIFLQISQTMMISWSPMYQDTVLNAAREVEDSMSGIAYIQREAEYILDGVATSKRSMELSLLQYEEGLVDYQRVLDSVRSMTQKQEISTPS